MAERVARGEEDALGLSDAESVGLLDTLAREVTVAANTGEGVPVLVPPHPGDPLESWVARDVSVAAPESAPL